MGLNYELAIQEELLSTQQRVGMAMAHKLYIPCPLGSCLICTPSALRPAALGIQVYISGKPLISMV